MIPSVQVLSYSAAVVAGLTGSFHCFAMCGGMAGALGIRARSNTPSSYSPFIQAAAGQTGRLLSYGIAGSLAGGFGAAFTGMVSELSVLPILRIGAGLLLIALALKLIFKLNLLAGLEKGGALLWRRIAPLQRHIGGHPITRSFLLGAIWGWLPCGMVYSMLLLAAFSGSALHGGGVLLAFGLGTLPAMLASSALTAHSLGFARARSLQVVAGALLLLFGAWTAFAPLHVHFESAPTGSGNTAHAHHSLANH